MMPLVLQVMGKTSAGKWSRSAGVGPSSLRCDGELPQNLKRQLAAKLHFSLSDFDDHLDNLKRCGVVDFACETETCIRCALTSR